MLHGTLHPYIALLKIIVFFLTSQKMSSVRYSVMISVTPVLKFGIVHNFFLRTLVSFVRQECDMRIFRMSLFYSGSK